MRACVPRGRRSGIEECTVLGVSFGVGGHELALSRSAFSHRVAILRICQAPAAIRTPGRIALASSLCGAGRPGRVRSLLVRDRDRRRGAFQTGSRPGCPGCRFPPSFSRAHQPKRVSGLVSDRPPATATAALCGASRASGRTATDCGFAARSEDLPFRRGGVGPAALRFGPFGETRVDARSDCNAPSAQLSPAAGCGKRSRARVDDQTRSSPPDRESREC
jgi:hypothetical protein